MKFIVAIVLVVGLVFGVVILDGVFDTKVEIKMNENVKKDFVEFTLEKMDETKAATDRAFEQLQQKLEKQMNEEE